jgi:cysteine synthase
MLPDTGERYLSTPLFEDIAAEMTDEEIAISRSTPRYRFDAPSARARAACRASAGRADPEAPSPSWRGDADAAQPVVMFALEWCEFCWSVRKLFQAFGIPYRSVDLDSVELPEGRTGAATSAACSRRAPAHRPSRRSSSAAGTSAAAPRRSTPSSSASAAEAARSVGRRDAMS